MTIRFLSPPTMGWIESDLEKPHMDFLWKAIKEGKKKNLSHKNQLVGHLTNSFEIEDKDDWFMVNVLYQNIDAFFESNYKQHPMRSIHQFSDEANMGIVLGKMWVNYQYQTEFNPFHNHSGLYSFVIWMKIPYSCKEQRKLKMSGKVGVGGQRLQILGEKLLWFHDNLSAILDGKAFYSKIFFVD